MSTTISASLSWQRYTTNTASSCYLFKMITNVAITKHPLDIEKAVFHFGSDLCRNGFDPTFLTVFFLGLSCAGSYCKSSYPQISPYAPLVLPCLHTGISNHMFFFHATIDLSPDGRMAINIVSISRGRQALRSLPL